MLADDSEDEDRSDSDEEKPEEDFFKAKAKVDKEESEEDKIYELPTLSKRKLRKIKEDGPYAGKNVLVFDSTGKAQPKPTVMKNSSQNYFESLRTNKVEGEDVLMMQGDTEFNAEQN